MFVSWQQVERHSTAQRAAAGSTVQIRKSGWQRGNWSRLCHQIHSLFKWGVFHTMQCKKNHKTLPTILHWEILLCRRQYSRMIKTNIKPQVVLDSKTHCAVLWKKSPRVFKAQYVNKAVLWQLKLSCSYNKEYLKLSAACSSAFSLLSIWSGKGQLFCCEK